MMDSSTKGPDSTSDRIEAPINVASEPSSTFLAVGSVPTATTAPPNRSLGCRSHRSRRGFASGKSRLSLKIDADCTTTGEGTPVTGQSTPASTSSSCSSDVVPWWEVEYQCPPPGHLGAHVVPVSADEQTGDGSASANTDTLKSSTTRRAETNSTRSVTIELVTPTQTNTTTLSNVIRPDAVLYETPERARRGPHSKLSSILASAPCLLVDSSPSQKRKMRPQGPTDCEFDLFSTPMTKELKRFHESSLKKSALPSRVVTPSTLVQPLTQIGISQKTRELKPRTATTTPATEEP